MTSERHFPNAPDPEGVNLFCEHLTTDKETDGDVRYYLSVGANYALVFRSVLLSTKTRPMAPSKIRKTATISARLVTVGISPRASERIGMSIRKSALAVGMLAVIGCGQSPLAPNPSLELKATASATLTASKKTTLTVEDLVLTLPTGWTPLSFDGSLSAQQGLTVNLAGVSVPVKTQASVESLVRRLLTDKELSELEIISKETTVRESLTFWTLRGRAQSQATPVEWIVLLAPREKSTVTLTAYSPDAKAIEANLTDFAALRDSFALRSPAVSPTASSTPSPKPSLTQATPTQDDPAATDGEPVLHFNQTLQWLIPKSWTATDTKWVTPENFLVKWWVTSEKETMTPKTVTRMLEQSYELSELQWASPPTALNQNDFRLWMAAGNGKKTQAGKTKAVDWHACLVEAVNPKDSPGQVVFMAIGPRGQSQQCRDVLLTLTRTIERSQMGATPTKIKIRVE